MAELEGSAVEAVVETPQAEVQDSGESPKLLHEQGLSKNDILERLMGTEDRIPEIVPEIEEVEAPKAPETPVEPAKAKESVIPGLEEEKPVEAPPEPKKDDVVDASADADAPGAGKFKVRAADGTFVDVPDVKVDFQIGEKVYKGKGIPELVRMAYDGVAGQRAIAQARQYEQETIPQLQQTFVQREAALQAEVDAQIALNAAILADATGETWAKHHEKFAQAQSPEAVAERAQQEAMTLRNTIAEQQAQQYSANVYATQVRPALDRVAQECPDVSDHTKAGIIADVTKDLLVNGRIPLERYPELVNRMNGPYAIAVRAEQARFAEARQKFEAEVVKAKADADAALRAAQARQNALVDGIKPVGGVPGSSQIQKPLPPPRNKEEARERIINRKYEG